MTTQDYPVGYGRPPAHTRFKKGVSGNPKGRPKKDAAEQNAAGILSDPISVRIGDRPASLQPLEIAIRKMLKDALQGNQRSLMQLGRLVHKHQLVPARKPPVTSGAVVIPKTMPMQMGLAALALFGPPPWNAGQIARARAQYLARRSAAELVFDNLMEYADL